ncbi:Laminin subunit alpha-1, partial [Nibea albiflora]
GLFPAILNLASNAVISSNATCGDPEPEVYCKLVEHVPGRRIKNPHCPKCDANSVLSKERHPITNAIDGTNQWWQSPSIKNGRQFHWITITLDLKQIFQVAYIIIKAANSPRPGNWILERSLDGVTFDPWQFYAISDSECLSRYNVTPRLGPPTYKGDTEVICTSYYSRLNPLEHGEYYYSIKDISVGGMCICYGHAQSCPLDPVTKVSPYSDSPCVECNCDLRGSESAVCSTDDSQTGVSAGQCVCKQGFSGQQCDRCAFGYRDFPHCVRCECHLSGSINTDPCSRCICKVNVMGAHCDLCKPGFYNLQGNNPLGCTDCFCFGVSDVCESSSWSTDQVLHANAWLHPSQPTHAPSVVSGNDLPTPGNTSSGHTHQQVLAWAAPDSFLGNKGNGRALRLSPPLLLFLSPLAERSVSMAMAWQRFLDVQTGLHVTRDDLLSVLADVISLRVRVHLNTTADGPIRLRSVSLDFADSSSVSGVQAVAVETCECPWGYSGTSCVSPRLLQGGWSFVWRKLYAVVNERCNDRDNNRDNDGINNWVNDRDNIRYKDRDNNRVSDMYNDRGNDGDNISYNIKYNVKIRVNAGAMMQKQGQQVSCDRCQEGYTGSNCERCASGFYGNPHIVGGACVRCECNGNVDVREAGHCDTVTGECLRCIGNTAGRHCEVCQPGHYGDAVHAKDCRGECLCRQNVVGRTCDRCQPGFFGLQSGHGCQACGCSQLGSLSESCDAKGRCQCAEGVAGHKCDRCKHGYYGFHANGCIACTCDHTKGNCDPESGECICPAHTEGDTCHRCETGYWGHDPVTGCKVGVSGRRCEECVSGWFALSADNPDGCSQCFCSGLSRDCEELGGLYRVPISLARTPALLSLVSQSNLQGEVSGVYQQGGDMLLDTREFNSSRLIGPLYWRLPPHFEGPQLLSYGALLSYIITFYAEDGSGLSNQEPQVLMRGGTLRKLVIYTDMVAPRNGIRTQHDVRMTEHTWKYFNSVLEKSVSRSDFMSVLNNIEYIIIKASYGTRLQQSRISNITMETAVEVAVEPEIHERAEVGEGVARLIESCICPPGYTGLSCQECAPGFFRKPLSELSSQSKKSLFIRPCVRCRCSGHSESCDAETGDCQGCQHHTSGRSCELCATGYYGNVSGSIGDCSLCACPRRDNSFSPTCVSEGAHGDFRCTACQTGYEGRYCERCSIGYYGNPSMPGGVCSRCSCSAWGSLQPLCDPLSGQCDCKAGVKGRSCDHCDKKHILQGGQCVSCDDKCSGVLLDELEKIHAHFLSVNLSAVAAAPYRQLVLLENQTSAIQVGVAALHLSSVEDELNHVTSDLSALMQQVTRLSNNLDKVGVSISQGALLLENISSLQDNIQVLQREAERLNQTKEDELSSANQTYLVHEMASMLETMRAFNLTAASVAANQELSLAESLVNFLQNHFLSSRAAADNKLRPLSASLSVDMEMLQCAYTHLNDAAQQNAQTHTLLNAIHTLLHRYQTVRHNLSTECLFEGGVMEDSQVLLDDAFSLTEGLTNTTTQVEVFSGQLDQWHPLLRKQNSSRMVQLDSDITERIDSAQQAASIAYATATLSLNMTLQSEQSLSVEGRAKLTISSAVLEESWSLQQTHSQAAVTHSGLQGALQRLHSLRQQLQDSSSVVENTNSTARETNKLVMVTHSAANEVQRKLEEVEHRTDHLMDRIKPLSMLGETLSRNLTDIRELIDQARRQAASADRDCVRSYRPQIHSSNFNTLSLTLKTSSPENLLFYLGSNTTVDFLAVQMHDGKVSLVWNVGSGSTKLEFPALDITNNRWTRINVTRFGAHGSLSVHQLEMESAPLPAVTATSPGPSRVLDIDRNSVIHIGGLGAHTQSPTVLRSSTFQGCLGEASLNERSIGLWNYISREGECGGCFSSTDTTVPVTMCPGYLSIMAADQSSEKEVLEAESPGTASDLNRSDLDPIYIGGLPTSRPIRWYGTTLYRGYSGEYYEDAVGCMKAVRSVSVLAGGFVQIAPQLLGQEAELLFSFSTKNQSGVLFAAFSDDRTQRQHFLSVHLVSGALEAELGEVGGATRVVTVVKPDGGSFSDGTKHSVIITINRKSLSMQVDEEHLKSVSLLPGGFSRLSKASLFIGGLPSGEESRLPIRLQDVSRWLVDLSGAIRYEGVELDSCLLEERVGGAVLPDDPDVEPTHDPTHLPIAPPTHLSAMTPGALMCVLEVEPTFLPSAAQFGLSKHSHMTFIINPNTVRRSVSVRLSVRSRALDGLIILLSDSKQTDFIVLRLTGGRLIMSADLGKGPASVTSSVTINDGMWHNVSAEVSRRSLSVSVNGSRPDSVTIKGNQLDIDDTLYLGGLPHAHITKRINVSSSFAGCVHSVSLNGAVLDLSKPASQHDVTSCFTNDQTGSYFNGSGYAIMIGQVLCDGRWHRLLARKTKHTLILSVDGRSYTTPNPYPQSTSAETNNPVYLGGYPVGVKQNCLSISFRFRGCLRNLQLNKSHLSDTLNLSSAHFLLGVTPNSCPIA